jgi:hypothetical protein
MSLGCRRRNNLPFFVFMRKALSVSIIVSVLALAAYFSKPSESKCIKKATEEFRSKIFYTVEAAPKSVDKTLFAETLEKSFMKGLEISDKYLYREIIQNSGNRKNKIGWGAFGWVNVEIK